MPRKVPTSLPLAAVANTFVEPFKKLRVRAGCLRGLNFLWLEITRSCNLTCEHCYVSSGPHLPVTERMEFADWCRVMDEARAIGCRRLQFIGGEPTVHPDLWRLIEHARVAGFRYREVFTNATLLSDESIDLLKEHGARVAVSFYSADPQIHDRITGKRGSFDQTVEGIRRLARRRVRLRAGIVQIEESADQLKRTKKFLRGCGVKSVETDRVRHVGRGEQFGDATAPMDELCGQCWSGKLCIDPNGDAFPCIFSRFAKVGNVLTDGTRGILEGDRLNAFRRQSYLGEPGSA